MKRFASIIAVTCLASFWAQGATLLSVAASDASATGTGVIGAGDPTIRVGRIGDVHYSAVLVFQISGISEGQQVTDASLSLQIQQVLGGVTPTHVVDLYGLDFRSSPSVLGSDFYEGPLDSSEGASLIASSFYTLGGNKTPLISESALTDYINDQLAAGAREGDYLFFRISSNAVLESTSHYVVSAGSKPSNYPTLSFNAVPEPSSAMLLSLVGMAGLFRRERRG